MSRSDDPLGRPVAPPLGWHVVGATAVLLTGASVLEGLTASRATLGPRLVIASILLGTAVLVARRLPLAGVAITAAATLVPYGPGGFNWGGAQLVALMALVAWAGFRLSTQRSVAAYVVAVSVTGGVIAVLDRAPWQAVFYTLVLIPAWAVGWLLHRERRRSAELARLAAELAAERERRTEVAVSAERTRIARELHDAVAHSVSVMTLQVGVARHRLGDDHPVSEVLGGAEQLGRQAVDELRSIVGLIRTSSEPGLAPLPSLTNLAELVESARAGGATVHLDAPRIGPLPPPVDMSAYRIVQESLTNALRHAPGAPITIELRRDTSADGLVVVVRNPVDERYVPGRTGNGIISMTERASALHGRLAAGLKTSADATRDFTVTAVLPVGRS